jgi:F-type H+-transporting ATPase subunit delta
LDRQGNGNVTEQIDTNLADIVALLHENADLARLWKHPVIDVVDKRSMVKQLFGGKVHPLALNLIQLLFDKKRGNVFEQVQAAYRTRFNETRRRATIRVTSALPLDANQVENIRHEFATKLSKEVHIDTSVDASLIGGLVVQLEDQVIDGSLRGRLEALRMSLN